MGLSERVEATVGWVQDCVDGGAANTFEMLEQEEVGEAPLLRKTHVRPRSVGQRGRAAAATHHLGCRPAAVILIIPQYGGRGPPALPSPVSSAAQYPQLPSSPAPREATVSSVSASERACVRLPGISLLPAKNCRTRPLGVCNGRPPRSRRRRMHKLRSYMHVCHGALRLAI